MENNKNIKKKTHNQNLQGLYWAARTFPTRVMVKVMCRQTSLNEWSHGPMVHLERISPKGQIGIFTACANIRYT